MSNNQVDNDAEKLVDEWLDVAKMLDSKEEFKLPKLSQTPLYKWWFSNENLSSPLEISSSFSSASDHDCEHHHSASVQSSMQSATSPLEDVENLAQISALDESEGSVVQDLKSHSCPRWESGTHLNVPNDPGNVDSSDQCCRKRKLDYYSENIFDHQPNSKEEVDEINNNKHGGGDDDDEGEFCRRKKKCTLCRSDFDSSNNNDAKKIKMEEDMRVITVPVQGLDARR